jgi:hypothetical protein
MTWPSGLVMSGIVSLVVEGWILTGMESASGRSRAYSVRYRGAFLAGVTVRRAVTRQSHAVLRASGSD